MSAIPRPSARASVALAAAGLGLVGAAAGPRVLVRRARSRPDPAAGDPLDLPSDATRHRITVSDGAELHVVERGPLDAGRPPILLLHGITLSAAVWTYQLRSLADAGWRVVAVDLRGHGSSTVGSDRLGLDRLAADVDEVCAHLDLRRTVVVGHSMGGMVALRALAGSPDAAVGRGRYGALALVATSASPVVGSGVPGLGLLAGAAGPWLARGGWLAGRLPGPSLPAHDIAHLLTRVTFGDDPSLRQIELTRAAAASVPARVAATLLLEIIGFDEIAALQRIALPAAVVVGTRDALTPVSQAQVMADAIPGATLTILEGCGHMVMLERHRALDTALTGVAGRVPPGEER